MIKLVQYPHMGIAHITTNDWELLLVLSRRGHTNSSPSHWVRLDLVDSILTGRTLDGMAVYYNRPICFQRPSTFAIMVLTL